MAEQSSRSQEDVAEPLAEHEIAKTLNEQAVARALGDSVLAGGVVGFVLAGAAFLGARIARVRRRRSAAGRARRG